MRMRRFLAITYEGLGALFGGFSVGAFVLVYFNIRDYDDGRWVWLFMIGVLLFLLGAAFIALGLVLHEPKWNMRTIEHPIAVGRSGAPEITDPMPSPARVRRPVSEAFRPEKRTLFKDDR